ncbi:mitochondrial import receptor subunit TOM22 homolog [Daphnia carinata]|uniref:mitochondrial import receptor subunit TOM22 homolog n=1 Tax=Daphnia carinata TaxID=120202 RepID=UPI00257B4E9A|nr:mitochondrial import receptor subunit TOM22 homolog [Daphnia carinata]
MATIEELDELSVEIINSINGEEEEESKENAPSPARVDERRNSESGDASVVAVSSSKAVENEDSDDDDEDFDETVLERLVGLTEMFPTFVQVGTAKLVRGTFSSVKGLYSFARSASWILFSTSAILFAPVIFEVERAQMEEMQKQQQRQILLGPGAAMSVGGQHAGMGGPGMGLAPAPPR